MCVNAGCPPICPSAHLGPSGSIPIVVCTPTAGCTSAAGVASTSAPAAAIIKYHLIIIIHGEHSRRTTGKEIINNSGGWAGLGWAGPRGRNSPSQRSRNAVSWLVSTAPCLAAASTGPLPFPAHPAPLAHLSAQGQDSLEYQPQQDFVPGGMRRHESI